MKMCGSPSGPTWVPPWHFFIHQPQHRIITFASPVKSHDIVKQTQKTHVTYDGPCYWNKIISTFDPLWKASLASYILDQLAATSFQQITTIKFDILPEGRSENDTGVLRPTLKWWLALFLYFSNALFIFSIALLLFFSNALFFQ